MRRTGWDAVSRSGVGCVVHKGRPWKHGTRDRWCVVSKGAVTDSGRMPERDGRTREGTKMRIKAVEIVRAAVAS